MVLPFEPFSLCWQHIYYSVDVPAGSDVKGDQVRGPCAAGAASPMAPANDTAACL